MTNPSDPRDYADLEQRAAGAIEAIRAAARLMRALAPVAAELRELQDAIAELQSAVQPPPRQSLGSARTESLRVPPPTPPAHLPMPESSWKRESEPQWTRTPDAAEPRPSVLPFPTARPETEPRPSGAETAGNGGRPRTVTVTVSRTEGPLDLVRVHSALDAIDGVAGLALASYTRGRAVILIDTDRSPERLALADALREAFPEGVNGHWLGESEYLATIGTPEPAGAP
jgi:hypothetical protein